MRSELPVTSPQLILCPPSTNPTSVCSEELIILTTANTSVFGNTVLLQCYFPAMGLSPGQVLRILKLKYFILRGSKSGQEGAEITSVYRGLNCKASVELLGIWCLCKLRHG